MFLFNILYFVLFCRIPPALKVTMHLRQANSVASSLNCLKRVTTSCSAWISAMILFSLWESVFSVFIPKENRTLQVCGYIIVSTKRKRDGKSYVAKS